MTLATRRLWIAGALVAAVALAVLAVYSAALARLPQQRSAIESFLREQTGFELRFERLAVQLGLYGPEARFGDVRLWRVGSARQLLQAPELVVRFETWRLLRSGTLRPGRILIVGAEIDADALRELEVSGRGAAARAVAQTPEQRLLQRLLDLARGLPPGRIELEAATLRGFERDADGAATGRLVSVPRLAVERSPGAARAHGGALLGGRLGRSLNVALELRGLDTGRQTVEGALTLQGRELRAEGWRAALGLPRDGWSATADLRVVLRLRGGAVQGGAVTVSGRDLQLPLDAGAEPARFASFSGELGFERESNGDWSVLGSDLRLAGAEQPPRRVDWTARIDASWRVFEVEAARLPLAWLRPVLATPALTSLEGDLDSLRLQLRRGAGEVEVRYAVSAAALRWRGGEGGSELAPLALRLEGDARAAQLVLLPTETLLTLHAADAAAAGQPERHAIAVTGSIDLRRDAVGWRAETRSLQIAERRAQDSRPRLDVSGAITLPRRGDSSVELGVTLLEPLDARELPALDRLAAAAAAVPVRNVALAGGRFTLRASAGEDGEWRLLGSSGELAVARADVTPGADWPAVAEAGGRLRWDDPQLRFEFERGAIAGLRLLRGRLERGATPRWALTLEGPVEAAIAALAATPLAAQLPAELVAARLDGPARFELQVESVTPTSSAGGADALRPVMAQRWSLQARLQGVRWRLLEQAPAIEGLSGTVRVVDGELAPTRLDGRWQNQPLTLVAQRRSTGPRWTLTGRWPSESTAALLPGFAAGRTLIGWRVDAAPVRGGAAERWRLDAALEDGSARALLELGASRARGFELQRGAVRFGGGVPVLPATAQLRLSGTLAAVELAQLASAWRGIRPLLDAGPPTIGDIDLRELALVGESLGPARLSFAATSNGAELVFDGARISGRLHAAALDTADAPQLRLARLTLPQLPGRAALQASAAVAPWAVIVVIDALRVGERSLGAARARLESDHERLVLRELRFAAGEWLASGTLDCQRIALRCDASLALAGGSARPAFDLWDVRGDLDAASFEGSASLSWPIAAAEAAWAALDGELRLTAVDGSVGAPARLGLLAASTDAWAWRDLVLEGRFRGSRLEIVRLALEGEQRLLLRGELGLRDAQLRLEGQWWPQRELPQALEDWPAAPTLAAVVRALRGRDIVPRPVQVAGPLASLEMALPRLQSQPAP
jgi:hypothetical protein